MGRRYRAAAVALFFALMSVHVGANAYRTYLASGPTGSKIIEVSPEGPAAGILREGDELLAMGGHGELTSGDAVNDRMRRVAPGEAYTVLVRREGRLQELTLRTRHAPTPALPEQYALRVLTPLAFLLTGLAVFLPKPFDTEALLLKALRHRGKSVTFRTAMRHSRRRSLNKSWARPMRTRAHREWI